MNTQNINRLRDGYYLSAYLDISPIGNIYEIGTRHDKCVALWKKTGLHIELIHYWELERLTGFKEERTALFNKQQCLQLLDRLLEPYDLTTESVEAIWGVPELHPQGDYLSSIRYPNYTYHTMCHLASGLFMETNIYHHENILAFSVDGGSDNVVDAYRLDLSDINGEWDREQFVGCYSPKKKADKLYMFPAISPGLLWTVAALSLSIKEGTLMALASASKSETYLEFENLFSNIEGDIMRDKALLPGELSKGNFDNALLVNALYNRFASIKKTIMELDESDVGIKLNYFDNRFSDMENKISMIMKVIMKMTFDCMDKNITHAIKEYHIDPKDTYLSMTGGFALSCPTNTYLMKKYGFKGFVAPPCPGDSGMALGIGLYAFYHFMDGQFEFSLGNAYHGDCDELDTYLQDDRWKPFIASVSDFDEKVAVQDLEKGVIVWFEGKAEMGPRALGARSLLGDPRKAETKDRLNEVKQRQWWRPVAPIIKKEHLTEWLIEGYESPYMLHACHVKEEKKADVPAIIHEDGTARLQSICPNNTWLYKLICAFHNDTGVPIICNTSLNDKGEPIINYIDQAFNFILRKGIQVGYFNGKRVYFQNHEQFKETKPQIRNGRIPIWETKDEQKSLAEQYNPNGYPARMMSMFVLSNLGKGKDFYDFDETSRNEFIGFMKKIFENIPYYNKTLALHTQRIARK